MEGGAFNLFRGELMAIIPDATDVAREDVDYPESDGRPVAETPVHRDNLLYSVYRLEQWFARDPMIYVSGNMFVYYERGNARKFVAPDVFVVSGVRRDKPRRVYKIWEEDGRAPDLVIEVTSRSTQYEDMEDKFELYRDILRVREYFLFDPEAEYLDWGCRLREGEYVPIPAVDGRLPSEVARLDFEQSGHDLRLYDPFKHVYLLTPPELGIAFDKLKHEASSLQTRNVELEMENERLRAELRALRGESGPR